MTIKEVIQKKTNKTINTKIHKVHKMIKCCLKWTSSIFKYHQHLSILILCSKEIYYKNIIKIV